MEDPMLRCDGAGEEKVYLQFPRMTVNLRRCNSCKRVNPFFFATTPVPYNGSVRILQKEVPGKLVKKFRRIIREMHSWPEIL